MDIIFTDITQLNLNPPSPAKKNIPEWYIKMEKYVLGEKKPLKTIVKGQTEFNTPSTIKNCMPVFDSITAGYILFTSFDLYIEQKNNEPFYMWSSGNIEFHSNIQVKLYPKLNEYITVPKFINNWSIQTPKGYSCLIIPPMHRPKTKITILPAIVDTDSYSSPINFPFMLEDKNFEGLIPAGTPMAQIIPFKREEWKSKIGDKKNIANSNKIQFLLQSKWFNSYKTQFWNKKEFN